LSLAKLEKDRKTSRRLVYKDLTKRGLEEGEVVGVGRKEKMKAAS